MAENPTYDKNFAPMPIADLLDGKHLFVIPSFQRGYRWEEKQVIDLLEDIKQFANDDNMKSGSYFLQPVVVKACKFNDKDAYEVLDGQQRLTTMLLLLNALVKTNVKYIKMFSTILFIPIGLSWISINQMLLTTLTATTCQKQKELLMTGLRNK